MARIVESGPITPVSIISGALPTDNIGQKTMANSLSVAIASNQTDVPITLDGEDVDTNIARRYTTTTLTYSSSADPTAFVDIRPYVMIEVLIPAAANGQSMDILFADDTSGTNKAIPKHKLSDDTWAALIQVASVSTGERYILQAENAAGHYFGLRFGATITGTVTIRLKG